MAKQLSVIQFKGKVGEVVGFKTPLAKGTEARVRKHQSSVSNPKTYAQARQRAKAVPAGEFYKAFEGVLNHAFIPSGTAWWNQQKFRSLALKNPVIPNVLRGEKVVPANVPYQVSAGSLGLDELAIVLSGANTLQQGEAPAGVTFSIYGDDSWLNMLERDVATISRGLIHMNPALENGMEICFLFMFFDSNDRSQVVRRWVKTGAFVLDVSNPTLLGKYMPSELSLLAYDNSYNLVACVPEKPYVIGGAACIISKRTSNSWIYTNSYWHFNDGAGDGLVPYADDEVIESYMAGGSSRTSDKYLQQADNALRKESFYQPTYVSIVNKPLTADFIPPYAPDTLNNVISYNPSGIAIVTDKDGNDLYVVNDRNVLLSFDEEHGRLLPIDMTFQDKQAKEQREPLILAMMFDGDKQAEGRYINASVLDIEVAD